MRRADVLRTVLAILAVFLGGAGQILWEGPAGAWHSGLVFAGLQGQLLGYVVGLALVARNWTAHRKEPADRPSSEGSARAPGGRRPRPRSIHAGSFGQRVFAWCAWGMIGLALMPPCSDLAVAFLEPTIKRKWPEPPPSPEVLDWERRYGERYAASRAADAIPGEPIPEPPDNLAWFEWQEQHRDRTRWAGALGSGGAGVLLVILASWLGPRPWIGPRPAVADALAEWVEPVRIVLPETRPRWGTISLAIGAIALPVNYLALLISINPLRTSYFPTTGAVVCAIAYACGIVAAFIANRRNERGFIRTSLGLLVNACALTALYWTWRQWGP